MPLLSIKNLDAGYDGVQILDNIDLEVKYKEYVAIVGPNGAGKSTVMKAASGVAEHMGGSIKFKNEHIENIDTYEIIKKGLSYVPQTENIFSKLTVKENLEMGGYILDDIPQERYEYIYNLFPILEKRKRDLASELSGGQQQMLAIGRAMMLDPDLLLLDEPSAGLAPSLVQQTLDKIDKINKQGTALLVVEQNAEEVLKRCDRGYILVQGKNKRKGKGKELLDDETVREDFLGY